jgi:hypothetical protein
MLRQGLLNERRAEVAEKHHDEQVGEQKIAKW